MSLSKNKEDARDLVQDAFTHLWQKKDGVDVTKVKAYLFTSVHNRFVDLTRKSGRHLDIEQAHVTAITHQPAHDLQAVLHEALDTLPTIQKSVILLRDYEGYNYDEIAEITGLNLSQVKVYIFRGRQRLKSYIGQMELVV